MPSAEVRLQQLIGAQIILIYNLQDALEQAQTKIKELEKENPSAPNPNIT